MPTFENYTVSDPTNWRGKALDGMTREEILAAFFDLHRLWGQRLIADYYRTHGEYPVGRALYAFWPPTDSNDAVPDEREGHRVDDDKGEM